MNSPPPPLPKKKKLPVFNHPTLGIDLYDGMAMDLYAITYAEPMLKEIERLREIEKAAREMFRVRGRFNTQIATCHLRDLLGERVVWPEKHRQCMDTATVAAHNDGPDNPPRLRKPGESVEEYREAMGWGNKTPNGNVTGAEPAGGASGERSC